MLVKPMRKWIMAIFLFTLQMKVTFIEHFLEWMEIISKNGKKANEYFLFVNDIILFFFLFVFFLRLYTEMSARRDLIIDQGFQICMETVFFF